MLLLTYKPTTYEIKKTDKYTLLIEHTVTKRTAIIRLINEPTWHLKVQINLKDYYYKTLKPDFISKNLLSFSSAISTIVNTLKYDTYSEDLKTKGISLPDNTRAQRGRFKGIREYNKIKSVKAISKRVSVALWQIIKENVPDYIIKAHKNACKVLSPTKYDNCSDLHEELPYKYFLKDLSNYPGAVMALPQQIRECFISNRPCPTNWIDLYSKEPYKALMKTLQKISRKPALLYLIHCKNIKLPKVYENNAEAYFVFYCLSHQNGLVHYDTIVRSDLKQFKKAMSLIHKHLYERHNAQTKKKKDKKILDFRQYRQCAQNYLHYIMDCNIPSNCEIVKLAERSIRWHQQQNEEQERRNAIIRLQREMNEAEAEKKYAEFLKSDTQKPPISLPDNECIKFLSSVQMVHDESKLMNHCVRSYAQQAVDGDIYLFHIDYEGDMATAEVSKFGILNQIRGPRNSSNQAAVWGKTQLEEWCKKLRQYFKENDPEIKLEKQARQIQARANELFELPRPGPYRRYVPEYFEAHGPLPELQPVGAEDEEDVPF